MVSFRSLISIWHTCLTTYHWTRILKPILLATYPLRPTISSGLICAWDQLRRQVLEWHLLNWFEQFSASICHKMCDYAALFFIQFQTVLTLWIIRSEAFVFVYLNEPVWYVLIHISDAGNSQTVFLSPFVKNCIILCRPMNKCHFSQMRRVSAQAFSFKKILNHLHRKMRQTINTLFWYTKCAVKLVNVR